MAALHPKLIPDRYGFTSGRMTEANSQSFEPKNFVYGNADALTEATSTSLILGMADEDATNVTSGNAEISFTMLTGNEYLEMSIVDDSGDDVAASTLSTGLAYGLQVVDSVHCVDSSDTTHKQFVFVRDVPNLNGDTAYRGLFRVAVAYLQVITGA